MKKKINWGLERLGPKYYGRLKDLTDKEVYRDDADSISLAANFNEINPGERNYITILADPIGAVLPKVIWESSNINIAKINSDGLLYAVSEGDVTITATPVDSKLSPVNISIHVGSGSSDFPPKTEIWYTTFSGEILDKSFEDTEYFGDNLTFISHTYENNLGVAKFSGGEVTKFLMAEGSLEDLKIIYIPESVSLFYGIVAPNLNSMYILATTPPELEDPSAIIVSEESVIYVPQESLDIYKSHETWSTFADKLVGC